MPSADGDLLGIFPINAVHNVVHLADIGLHLGSAAILIGVTFIDQRVDDRVA